MANSTIQTTAYRGQHGKPTEKALQTRLGSPSFGSFKTARHYAVFPNDRRDRAAAPRVIKARITLKNPVIHQEDPFIDLDVLINAIGIEKAARIASDLSHRIVHLSCWEPFSSWFTDVDELLTYKPGKLGELYVQAYHVFDNHMYVEWLRGAGYDGAAFWGTGENEMEMEYRPFTANAVEVIEVMPVGVQPNLVKAA